MPEREEEGCEREGERGWARKPESNKTTRAESEIEIEIDRDAGPVHK